jgi:hypothetical protein
MTGTPDHEVAIIGTGLSGYQFSYELKPDWSRLFPNGAEVKGYIDDYVSKYGIRPHIRFASEVTARTWDEGVMGAIAPISPHTRPWTPRRSKTCALHGRRNKNGVRRSTSGGPAEAGPPPCELGNRREPRGLRTGRVDHGARPRRAVDPHQRSTERRRVQGAVEDGEPEG